MFLYHASVLHRPGQKESLREDISSIGQHLVGLILPRHEQQPKPTRNDSVQHDIVHLCASFFRPQTTQGSQNANASICSLAASNFSVKGIRAAAACLKVAYDRCCFLLRCSGILIPPVRAYRDPHVRTLCPEKARAPRGSAVISMTKICCTEKVEKRHKTE